MTVLTISSQQSSCHNEGDRGLFGCMCSWCGLFVAGAKGQARGRRQANPQENQQVSRRPSRAVDTALVILEEFWRRKVSRAGADPPAPNQQQQKQLRWIVVAEHGKAKVTISYRHVLAGSWQAHCLALASESRLCIHEASPEDLRATGRLAFASACGSHAVITNGCGSQLPCV